MTLETKHVEEI